MHVYTCVRVCFNPFCLCPRCSVPGMPYSMNASDKRTKGYSQGHVGQAYFASQATNGKVNHDGQLK